MRYNTHLTYFAQFDPFDAPLALDHISLRINQFPVLSHLLDAVEALDRGGRRDCRGPRRRRAPGARGADSPEASPDKWSPICQASAVTTEVLNLLNIFEVSTTYTEYWMWDGSLTSLMCCCYSNGHVCSRGF